MRRVLATAARLNEADTETHMPDPVTLRGWSSYVDTGVGSGGRRVTIKHAAM